MALPESWAGSRFGAVSGLTHLNVLTAAIRIEPFPVMAATLTAERRLICLGMTHPRTHF
jgi:hypothetical protein